MIDSDRVHRILEEIKRLHSRHGDDLCWMPGELDKLFELAELPKQDRRVGDKFAMLKNCVRYVECLEEGGPWRTYAELEAVLRQLADDCLLKYIADGKCQCDHEVGFYCESCHANGILAYIRRVIPPAPG